MAANPLVRTAAIGKKMGWSNAEEGGKCLFYQKQSLGLARCLFEALSPGIKTTKT
jgi:hypothetical protein